MLPESTLIRFCACGCGTPKVDPRGKHIRGHAMRHLPRRPIRVEGDIAYIPLSKGYEAKVDSADVPLVESFPWHAWILNATQIYAASRFPRANGQRGKSVSLHRLLTDAPAGMVVDHINHDGLDNRRSNLRVCSNRDNSFNRRDADPKGRTGVNNVTVYRRPAEGYVAYKVTFSVDRYFPYTDEGFARAKAEAERLRPIFAGLDHT